MINQIKYCSGYKYQLVEDYFHVLPMAFDSIESFELGFIKWNPSILLIKRGYAWDGPSGPALDTKDFMRASLVHDALYQCMRQGLIDISLRKVCDEELRRICIEAGMCSTRAAIVYDAVRLFGENSATEVKEIQTAS
jgi:hypothetical protein